MRKLSKRNFLTKMALFTLTAFIFVSCGSDNESGGSSSSGISYPGISVAGNGMTLPSNWLEVVKSENSCLTYSTSSNERIHTTVPLTGVNVNAGAFYVGVTPEGDIGIVSNQSSGPIMELYLCPRSDMTGQGSLMAQPVLNNSQECPIGEVTAANISLGSQYGSYNLSFAPININGTNRYSSLCSNNNYYYN